MIPTHQSSPGARFLRGRVNYSKNRFQEYEWPQNGSLFRDQVFYLFFKKFAKRWLELDFCGVKKAVKKLKETNKKKDGLALLPKVSSMLDKLAKKNVIHKNKASNLKSKLTKHVSGLSK